MAGIHFFSLFTIIFLIICYGIIGGKDKKAPRCLPAAVFGGALLLRLLLAYASQGFNTDINCFAAWGDRMWQLGPGGFYSPDVFSDYPPGFLYYLYLVGGLCDKLKITFLSNVHILLLKLPAILCDMACGWLIYREAEKRLGEKRACFLAASYLYLPAIVLDSAMWGQVDSILTLALVVMCLMLIKGRLPAAYAAFGLGILVKPQILVFTPVLLAGILDHVFLKDFSLKKLGCHLLSGLGVIAGMVVLCIPFGLDNVFHQYMDTLGEYPYAAVNACNFWGLLGKNWVSQDERFLLFSYRTWGSIVIVAIVALVFLFSLRKRKDAGKYPLLAAFSIVTMFAFSARMHERYLYPGIAMLLLAYLFWPEKGIFLCYGGFSMLCFYNMAWVLYFYDASDYDRKNPFLIAVSAGGLLCVGYLYYLLKCWYTDRTPVHAKLIYKPDYKKNLKKNNKQKARRYAQKEKKRWESAFAASGDFVVTRTDILILTALTVVYAAFALVNLGDRKAPETVYEMTQEGQIELLFEEAPASFSYYIGPWHERTFRLETREDEFSEWMPAEDITLKSVFSWQKITLEQTGRQLRMTLASETALLFEMRFQDSAGNGILPLNAAQYAALFDEQELCPERNSFRNSTYFDEIYHARTAYEYLHGLYSYENTHPPLGKIWIALGILIFGMNPFGWRIVGTVFGILMVPLAYLFGKKFTDSTIGAFLSGALFAFDFMHFTQTRIATIDVYITFFVMLMYFFMYQYASGCLRGEAWRKCRVPLGLCGVSMGLGVACKWTGIYAGLGLALIFFLTLFWQYKNREKKEFLSEAKRTILFCVLFFVCIPAAIYLLSYLPFVDGVNTGLLQRVLHNQQTMFNYHSKLEATHAFSSPWYQWPFMVRPVWYYSGNAGGTLREGISAFGNPLVWWMGVPALLCMIRRILKYRDGKALFLVIAYAAQYLPWVFVSRLTFIYHYFPSVMFVVLMIVYTLQCWAERLQTAQKSPWRNPFLISAAVYALAAFGLFVLFYPVLSGAPVEIGFVDRWLRWSEEWVLVSG